MIERIVASFAEYDQCFDGADHSLLCRGVNDARYKLIPSLFRRREAGNFQMLEDSLLWLFKTHAAPHLRVSPPSDLAWIVIGQHHGLPTRLLDWSLSPLVALYFAVNSKPESDGAVYSYDVFMFRKEENIDLKQLDEIVAFIPSHSSRRVTAQSGQFTVHPFSAPELDNDRIVKYIVPSKLKAPLRRKLAKYGVHEANLFPDLDGLSAYLKWLKEYE